MFTRVHQDFFANVLSSEPDAVTPAIQKLCDEIAPGRTPQFVRLAPHPEARVRECFYNVRARVEAEGGDIVYGWAIWRWPKVFIEAEHHAVWRAPGGELVDVTPHEYPATRVLFLEDPGRPYDFETNARRMTWRRPLRPLRVIQDFIDLVDEHDRTLEAKSVGREYHLSRADRIELDDLFARRAYAQVGIILTLANELRGNDACLCRSGRKFRSCCAPLFR